jgi:hypothetical protein
LRAWPCGHVPDLLIAQVMFPCASIQQLILGGYVAPLPIVARARISERYACDLTTSGCGVSGISILRELISSLDSDLKFARALLISAPHTHWGNELIVESFDPQQQLYFNGAAPSLASSADLCPISFVFSRDGATPYEWADNTVPLNQSDLDELYAFISRLNQSVVTRFSAELPIPLGIMIDHRFKKSIWDAQLFTFAEGRHDEHDGRAIVWPTFQSVIHDNPPHPNTVQVAWSAFPNSEFFEPVLTEAERLVLTQLEDLVKSRAPDEALEFVNSLESYLRSKIGQSPEGRQ